MSLCTLLTEIVNYNNPSTITFISLNWIKILFLSFLNRIILNNFIIYALKPQIVVKKTVIYSETREKTREGLGKHMLSNSGQCDTGAHFSPVFDGRYLLSYSSYNNNINIKVIGNFIGFIFIIGIFFLNMIVFVLFWKNWKNPGFFSVFCP